MEVVVVEWELVVGVEWDVVVVGLVAVEEDGVI